MAPNSTPKKASSFSGFLTGVVAVRILLTPNGISQARMAASKKLPTVNRWVSNNQTTPNNAKLNGSGKYRLRFLFFMDLAPVDLGLLLCDYRALANITGRPLAVYQNRISENGHQYGCRQQNG